MNSVGSPSPAVHAPSSTPAALPPDVPVGAAPDPAEMLTRAQQAAQDWKDCNATVITCVDAAIKNGKMDKELGRQIEKWASNLYAMLSQKGISADQAKHMVEAKVKKALNLAAQAEDAGYAANSPTVRELLNQYMTKAQHESGKKAAQDAWTQVMGRVPQAGT